MNIDGVIKDQNEEVLQEHIPVWPAVWEGPKEFSCFVQKG